MPPQQKSIEALCVEINSMTRRLDNHHSDIHILYERVESNTTRSKMNEKAIQTMGENFNEIKESTKHQAQKIDEIAARIYAAGGAVGALLILIQIVAKFI